MNSKAKGKRGELELAHRLTELGCAARRGQQFKGTADSPDVVCSSLIGVHFECKRTETLRIYEAMDQAISECAGRTPVVAHKKNRRDWLVVLRLEDFVKLAKFMQLNWFKFNDGGDKQRGGAAPGSGEIEGSASDLERDARRAGET